MNLGLEREMFLSLVPIDSPHYLNGLIVLQVGELHALTRHMCTARSSVKASLILLAVCTHKGRVGVFWYMLH